MEEKKLIRTVKIVLNIYLFICTMYINGYFFVVLFTNVIIILYFFFVIFLPFIREKYVNKILIVAEMFFQVYTAHRDRI